MSNLGQALSSMENNQSIFEQEIRKLPVPVCGTFVKNGRIVAAGFKKSKVKIASGKDEKKVTEAFSKSVASHKNNVLEGISESVGVTGKRVAVLFSGGPAAGGHNVVVGIYKALGKGNTLLGVKSGPKGLLAGDLFKINDADIANIVNTGGFDFLGSDRTKIKTDEQFTMVKAVCKKHKLDAIIVVGGDDSNTNAAILAEYLYDDGVQVIGVPKTIDGDLQVGDLLPISFGFDTATKIYSEMVGNILQDTPSSRKYWHFIKLMGRSASHVAIEVALQAKPAICLISEEVESGKKSLAQIVQEIADAVIYRAAKGVNHGVVLIPEGLVEFIPEMKSLIAELNEVMAAHSEGTQGSIQARKEFIYTKLKAKSAKLMSSLPDEFENMLLLDRDSHGNLQVSQIPTEKLLIEMVKVKIAKIQKQTKVLINKYSEKEIEKVQKYKFATNHHFFGYEGRCGAPTLFDAAYTLNLGLVAGSLVLAGKTGYIAGLSNLDSGVKPVAVPLTALINIERRHGKDEFVIEKALTELDSPAFKYFAQRRDKWAKKDLFASPGPRQLWGPSSRQMPISIALNRNYRSLEFNFGMPVNLV
ncbi:diphosphate--fructose-6-phosphate 1-phosphotransferase [Candidatus Margulisiibacteriota bacterium]